MKKISILLVLLSLFVLAACSPSDSTEAETYTITFITNGGSSVEPLIAEADEDISLPSSTKSDYTFIGWFKDDNLTESFTSVTMPEENLTLYAKWNKNSTNSAEYTINYYLENSEGVYELDSSNTLTGDVGETVSIDIINYTGYKLFNEHPEINLNGDIEENDTLVLNAYYMRKEYTVTFKDFDDEIITTDIVLYQKGAVAPSNPTRFGYTFDKWDKSFNEITSDLEVKALYVVNNYKISFNTNGGDETLEDLNVDYKSVINDLPEPIKEGFTFLGWYLEDEKIELPYEFNYTNDILLVAKWTDSPAGLTYEVVDEEVTILSYTGTNTHFDLPDTIDGFPVTKLAENAFSGNSTIETITLSINLKELGHKSLSITSLKEIVIPNSVSYIDKGALFGTSSLTSITLPFLGYNQVFSPFTRFGHIFGKETYPGSYRASSHYIPLGLKEVILTNDTKISDNAFSFVKSVSTIVLNEGVTSIGRNAFSNTTELTSITIPEGVTEIKKSAFSHTESLTNLTVPKSLETLGESVFYYSALEEITFLEESNMTEIGVAAFKGAVNLKTITLPSNLKTIQTNAFVDAESLTDVVLPEGIETIGDRAFQNTGSLVNINIPSSITEIGESAFYEATSLTSFVIPGGVTKIKRTTFANTTSLTSITIPNGVTVIGYGAFFGTKSLTSINIPSSVTTIGNRAFEVASALTSITIPSGVKVIGEKAFLNASSLETVNLPSSIERIELLAFGHTTSLTNINIPNGVEYIGRSAFREATVLVSIYIPISVTYVGKEAFYDSEFLKITVETADQTTNWNSGWASRIKEIIYVHE